MSRFRTATEQVFTLSDKTPLELNAFNFHIVNTSDNLGMVCIWVLTGHFDSFDNDIGALRVHVFHHLDI